MFCSGLATAPARIQAGQQPATEVKTQDASAQSSQNPDAHSDVQQAAPPASTTKPPSPSPAAKKPHAPAKGNHQNKARSAAPCNVSASSKTPSPATASDPPAASSSAEASSPAKADLPPCPPPKIVVRNGGTSEGTVQISGGSSAGKESPRRAGTDKLLGSTEQALKKIDSLQLDSTQQQTAKQIHQYIVQSKTALAAGDLDLAHNLALKAHLLADELLKPRM
jgi:hypothetical protein